MMGTHDYNEPTPAEKLRRVGDTVYAIAGLQAWFDAWIDWHKNGCDPEKTPVVKNNDAPGQFIVFKDGRCFVYIYSVPYAEEHFAPAAFGSGWKYALGAMTFGADARQAVDVCIRLDPGCGGPVQAIDLRELQQKADAA